VEHIKTIVLEFTGKHPLRVLIDDRGISFTKDKVTVQLSQDEANAVQEHARALCSGPWFSGPRCEVEGSTRPQAVARPI
jgi:hypothetical protein